MNRTLAALVLAFYSFTSQAGDIATAATYFGSTQGIGVGFFGHVGVGLPVGQTCHGSNIVILLNTNPQYKEILSVLLAAEAGKQSVKFYQLGAQTTTFGSSYCVITAASLGDFPIWPV